MIYLDNSATTRPFEEVLSAVDAAAREGYFNPSSLYAQAMLGEGLLKGARLAVLKALGASEGSVVFTSGGTEADNLAILGAAFNLRGRKGHFLYGAAEHPAVARAMEALAAQGHAVEAIPVDAQGIVRPSALLAKMRPDTALVSVQHVNNEVGAVQPVDELASAAHGVNPQSLFHVDGVQAFLRVPPPTGADLYALSAHKVHGPRGVGALWVRKGIRLAPMLLGGEQQEGLRAGTQNAPGAEGLRAAIEAYAALPDPAQRMMALKLRLHQGILAALPGARVNGPPPQEGAPHILNISFDLRGEVLLHALEGEGILVSTGSACSSRRRTPSQVLVAMGLSPDRAQGAIRFSLSPMNTKEEIDRVAEALSRLVPQYRRFRRK